MPLATESPQTIDTYLSELPLNQKTALNHLRQVIQDAAAEATECIAYQVPTFRLYDLMLVSFGAAKKHCAFYPGTKAISDNEAALARFDTSKGTIRFQPDDPISDHLIRDIVHRRAAENKARFLKRKFKKLMV